MKPLTLLTTLIITLASSNAFANSPAGKVLFCKFNKFELSYGFVFLDELHVEHFYFDLMKQKVKSVKTKYETNLRHIKITLPENKEFFIIRKNLKARLFYDSGSSPAKIKCSIQKSKEELVNFMRSGLKEIMDNNKI